MTVDEELGLLDENLRRLKIEYDIYFGGGSKRLPQDLEWRVQATIKKFGDSKGMNFAQRFRYNSIAQKYAVFSDLWRQKNKIKEEGLRRPADALLAIQGVRAEVQEEKVSPEARAARLGRRPIKIELNDVSNGKAVQQLFEALCGRQKSDAVAEANFRVFESFLANKTEQIKSQFRCRTVEYEVAFSEGKLNLKARPKT